MRLDILAYALLVDINHESIALLILQILKYNGNGAPKFIAPRHKSINMRS